MFIMFQPLAQYATFSGRARRKEYWLFILFLLICQACIGIIALETGIKSNWPSIAFTALTVIPQLAVTVRRLHDTNRRGWWALIWLLSIPSTFGLNFSDRYLSTADTSSTTQALTPPGATEWVMLTALSLITLLIVIYYIVLLCSKSTQGSNRFGPNPLPEKTTS